MKEFNSTLPEDISRIGFPPLSPVEEQLINIYWCKKELDEYLPNIATYATPKEVTAITLSQLAVIEKHLVAALHQLSEKENTDQPQ